MTKLNFFEKCKDVAIDAGTGVFFGAVKGLISGKEHLPKKSKGFKYKINSSQLND